MCNTFIRVNTCTLKGNINPINPEKEFTYEKHSIRYIGPVTWSKLSRHIKNSELIDSFKRQVRKVDIQNLLSEECKNCHLCNA